MLESAASASHPSNYIEAMREMKRQLVTDGIAKAGGSYAEAAQALGILPHNLHRLARNLGLKYE